MVNNKQTIDIVVPRLSIVGNQGWHQKIQPKKPKNEKKLVEMFFFVILIINHLVDYLNLTLNISRHF